MMSCQRSADTTSMASDLNAMFGPIGGSPGDTASTVLYQGHTPLSLHYRPLHYVDYESLKAIHQELFPIDYEEIFFRKAVAGEDRVFSWAALHNEYGRDHLVGFVTARVVYMYECDSRDRQVMGLSAKCLDGDCAVYVLTLGVVPACRQCGIARSLLGLVHQHATRLRCRAIFLHVISYNNAAMRLYGTSGYQAMARLPNFYHLVTGRQPNPDQSWYDSFLYALFIPSNGPEPSPTMQWAGGMLGAAVAPLRSMLGTFHGCIPSWFCRQTYSTFKPFASTTVAGPSQRSASKAGLADTATSIWQPPPPPPPPAHQQQAPSPTLAASQPSPWELHSQQLPASTSAGVVCAAVTAEQFLKRGHQQQHPLAHHHQQQMAMPMKTRCSGVERRQKDGRGHGEGIGGSSSGTERHAGSQPQQQANAGSASCVADGGTCDSSAASSASASGDYQQQQFGDAALPPLPAQPPQPPLQTQSNYQNHHYHQNHGPQQHHQQFSQVYGAPVLRPPSPPVPPSLSSSITTVQQRHPHNGLSSPASFAGWAGHGSGLCRSQQSLQGAYGPQYSAAVSAGIHGRAGELGRSGIHRGPPGLGGGGLSSHLLQQQQLQQSLHQQQQQRSSVLATLFKPPSTQSHPHSR